MKKLKKESSKNSILLLLKQKKLRMRLYKAIWDNYHERDIMSLQKKKYPDGVIFIINVIRKQWGDLDPNIASELWVVYRAVLDITKKAPIPLSLSDIQEIHEKYWKRFHTFYWTKKKGGVSLPHLPKTRALKEFLERGFVHEDTFTFSSATPYRIKCNIGPLVWFEAFTNQAAALEVAGRVCVPGWGGVPVVKN